MAVDIKELFTRKIGPLPTIVWVAIPAGGYIAYSYYRAATGDDEPTGDEFAPVTDSFDTGYPSLPDLGDDDTGTGNRREFELDPYTNADWERDAVGWAIGQGMNPLDAVTAVRAYLYGRPSAINQGQLNILRQIITAKGAAPDGGNIPPLITNNRPPPGNNAVPRPPSNVSLRRIQGKVQATWNASSTANVRYEVERKHNRGPWVLMRVTDKNHAEFEGREGTHTVRVRARNRHGSSAYVQSAPLTLARSTEPRQRQPRRRTG